MLDEWTQRQAVAGELSQLLDPRPEVELDITLLVQEFEALDYEPDLFHDEVDFEEVIAGFARAFYEAAADEPELQEPIKIGLLRGIAERTEQLVGESRAQTQELKQQTAALETLVSLMGGRVEARLAPAALRQATTRYFQVLAGSLPLPRLQGHGRVRPGAAAVAPGRDVRAGQGSHRVAGGRDLGAGI